ncbi:MAG TPA: response regulator [Chlamydiales bacterium]|nr:response regulator [Chlamydiales bacterium]
MSKQLRLPTLLMITDNPSIRFWVKKHLDDDFFIINAETAEEALDALNARLDFIIVDAELEACDALDLCRQISKLTQKGLVPILLVTGRLKKSYRDEALASGVTDFLSDQLDIEELRLRIASGKKNASSRQKTEDLALTIKAPKIGTASLKNKFVLNDQAVRLLAAAKNGNIPVALLLMRIDQHKDLNLEEIHPLFSEFVNSFLRKNDLLFPSSEGGFVVLLSNMKVDKAHLVAERLRNVIQQHPFLTRSGPKHLTVSIAVSSLEASEKGFSKMIASAAKSLKTHSETNLIISLDQETP